MPSELFPAGARPVAASSFPGVSRAQAIGAQAADPPPLRRPRLSVEPGAFAPSSRLGAGWGVFRTASTAACYPRRAPTSVPSFAAVDVRPRPPSRAFVRRPPPPAVINYTVQRGVPPPPVAAEELGPQMAATSASISAAARAVSAARPVLSQRDLEAAAAAGIVTPQQELLVQPVRAGQLLLLQRGSGRLSPRRD